MKIAFIGHKGYPSLYGGVEKVVEEIVNRLADRGHECLVYCREHYSHEDYTPGKNIERVIVKGWKTRRLDTLSHTFLSLLDVLKRDVDIITIHSFGNAILNFIPKLKGIPVTLHLHGFEWGQKRFNFLERNVLLRLPLITLKLFSDSITSVSMLQHKELLERKIYNSYLPNGVDIKKKTIESSYVHSEKYILYVGRIAIQKGIEYLIKAFNLQINHGFKLKIVGDHEHAEKYYNTLLTLAKGNENIEFLGYKYGNELNQLYAKAYCVVIPSESEECPMVLLEALAFNKCIIGSRIPGIYHIAKDNIIYFENKDHIDLSNKLKDVCYDEKIKNTYEENLKNRDWMNEFNWESIVDRYEDMYQSLVLDNCVKRKKLQSSDDVFVQYDQIFDKRNKNLLTYDLNQNFRLIHKLYYSFLRPILPKTFRKSFQRFYKLNLKFNKNFIEPIKVSELRNKPTFNYSKYYPEPYSSAIILTHDVDSKEGFEYIPKILSMTRDYNFRSCWYIIPYKYKIDSAIIDMILEAGDEIGIHGYNHDGKLFSSRKEFFRRAPLINDAIKQFNSSGFRAPMVHRKLNWIKELEIEYDSSSFDYDPFQPFPGGTGLIYPFKYDRLVELSYTIPQDHTLFYELKQKDITIWINKIEWLLRNNGMILSITHPDYLIEMNHFAMYKELLEYLSTIENTWKCLPREIANYYNISSETSKKTLSENIVIA
jgi:glycosyltransferase involved in cell wall biosynthesis/peptidoglycan/xylan/chitin deacetylase (PgdA/CDA1 family)